ncbi:MAG: patatin [Planctomycetaceae bacterium]|nr:MAG: patatin [Planctomycetaceae bacterium]
MARFARVVARGEQSGETDMTFRILALDGGGIKGSFTAGVLAALEKDTGHRCVDHFDLIAGTSTGGIIAIGLGLGLSAAEIVDFYTRHGPTIFPSTSLARRWFGVARHLFQPKHSHQTLRSALTQVLGERKFGDSIRPLVIPTYDAVGGRIFLLKTGHHAHLRHDVEAPAVEVALATAAAPTYFAATRFPDHGNNSYVDGGVWANSPALAALVEAVHFLGQRLEDIDILSIGTTSTPFNVAQKHRSGILGWNAGLVEILMTAQQEAANAQAMLLVDRRFHRIDHQSPRGQFSLDDARPEQIERLIALGRGEAVKKANIEAVGDRFLNGRHAPPFQPLFPSR